MHKVFKVMVQNVRTIGSFIHSSQLIHCCTHTFFLGLIILVFTVSSAVAAPTDFNGDGISDPAAVSVGDELSWHATINGSSSSVRSNFGELGNHLVPGHYSGSAATEVGYLDSNGGWHIALGGGVREFSFGTSGALYLSGADVDGDGRDDALYQTNFCKRKRSVLFAKTAITGDSGQTFQLKGSRGRFHSTYADVNGDGRDDYCFTKGIKRRRKLTGQFLLECRDVSTGAKVVRTHLGSVYERPLAVRTTSGAGDILALPHTRKGNLKVRLFSPQTGKTLKNLAFANTGTFLVGNYTNSGGGHEQLAVADGEALTVYDIDSDSFQSVAIPDGVPFDELNIVSFVTNADSCACTTDKIGKNGRCHTKTNGGGGGGKTSPDGACQVQRELTDGGGNWLHKPVSDSTGSVVNLFNPADNPSACRYENKNGDIFKDAYFTGNSNPDRPTYRPVGGGSCRSFPSPLVVTCVVRGQKHCWTIPNPCVRYD